MGANDTIYQMVTEKILARLEAGTAPWHKPWKTTLPVSLSSRKPYRGINVFLLGISASDAGYSSPYWGTFKHIQAMGGMVRKGEKSTMVVFWKKVLGKRDPDDPEGKPRRYFMLRYYRVFNAEQADGLPDKFYPAADSAESNADAPQEAAEKIMAGYLFGDGPSLRHQGERAHYQAGPDTITLPPRPAFDNVDAYYLTAFHEMTHSTGHTSRLNRPGIVEFDHFGSQKYAKEELAAQMGAAMLSAMAGVDGYSAPSASYVANWLTALRGDVRLVVLAASQAQRATDLVLGTEYADEPTNGDAR